MEIVEICNVPGQRQIRSRDRILKFEDLPVYYKKSRGKNSTHNLGRHLTILFRVN